MFGIPRCSSCDLHFFLIRYCHYSALLFIFEKVAQARYSEFNRWRLSDFPHGRILRILISSPSTYKYNILCPSKLNCCLIQKPWRPALFQNIPGSLPFLFLYINIIPRIFWISQFWPLWKFHLPLRWHRNTLPNDGEGALLFSVCSCFSMFYHT